MLYNDATKGKRKNYDAFHNFYNITPKKLFIWYPAYFRQQNGVLHRNYGMSIRLIISMLLVHYDNGTKGQGHISYLL